MASLRLRLAAASIERMKNGYSGTLISSATIACTTVVGIAAETDPQAIGDRGDRDPLVGHETSCAGSPWSWITFTTATAE